MRGRRAEEVDRDGPAAVVTWPRVLESPRVNRANGPVAGMLAALVGMEALAARPGSDPGVLARHWQLAGRPDRAAPAAVLAARYAVSVRAYPEASRH